MMDHDREPPRSRYGRRLLRCGSSMRTRCRVRVTCVDVASNGSPLVLGFWTYWLAVEDVAMCQEETYQSGSMP